MMEKTGARRALIVDDYRDAREMYAEYLRFSGFEVIEAGNGSEAIQRALDSNPDIILMDLSLPIMDGWEATRRLKQDRRTAGIPIVALTGRTFAHDRQAEWDAFLTKPCLPEDLVKKIDDVLGSGNSSK